MATAAIWYESDGYRLEGRPLMGRRVAGQEFLKAFCALCPNGSVHGGRS
jgi:hypothetical protein